MAAKVTTEKDLSMSYMEDMVQCKIWACIPATYVLLDAPNWMLDAKSWTKVFNLLQQAWLNYKSSINLIGVSPDMRSSVVTIPGERLWTHTFLMFACFSSAYTTLSISKNVVLNIRDYAFCLYIKYLFVAYIAWTPTET